MSSSLIHTLDQALQTLEEQHDRRTADRLVQRIRFLPEKYQHISYKVESVVQLGYPSVLTDQVIDELEHILHEVREESRMNKGFSGNATNFDKKTNETNKNLNSKKSEDFKKTADRKAYVPVSENVRIQRESEEKTKRHPLVKTYGDTVPDGVITVPYFQKRARHPYQKVMKRIQEREKIEKRIEFFNKAIVQSGEIEKNDGNIFKLKPEIDLNIWLRPEYLPTAKFNKEENPEILDISNVALIAKYLEPSEVDYHFSDESLGEDVIKAMKEDGHIFFYHTHQWARILKQSNRFVFGDEDNISSTGKK